MTRASDKNLIIFINGSYKSRSATRQTARLLEEGNAIVPTTICENLYTNLNDIGYNNNSVAIFLDKDIYKITQLEYAGVSVFNNSIALAIADDKGATALAINGLEGIKIPRTIIAPKLYFGCLNTAFLDTVVSEIGYPIVVKECSGSLGQQVYLANDYNELLELSESLGTKPHLYQEYIGESCGKSIRAYVVGGEVVASGLLTSKNDFRSNAENGGTMSAITLSENMQKAVVAIANKLGLTFGGIDMFATEEPIFIEANSNAYFAELERCSGVNIAKKIVETVLKESW